MKVQFKDKFYDDFLKEPTKANFRVLLKDNFGELDEFDFKKEWIDKGSLSKIVLAMANSRGGMIVFGVEETENGDVFPVGLSEFRDSAEVNDEIIKYIGSSVYYKIFNFNYEESEYEKVKNKKFQILLVYDTPDRLPFVSLNKTSNIEKDIIYVRRGTKCEKATSAEIHKILDDKIQTIFKETSNLTLDEHLGQLKKLYNELPKKINILVRKGEPTGFEKTMMTFGNLFKTNNEYEEIDNPNYPDETYEAFIIKMINSKKIKIEKVLDLK